MVNKSRLGSHNKHGEKWLEWCTVCSAKKQAKANCNTWLRYEETKKNQTDYISINEKFILKARGA